MFLKCLFLKQQAHTLIVAFVAGRLFLWWLLGVFRFIFYNFWFCHLFMWYLFHIFQFFFLNLRFFYLFFYVSCVPLLNQLLLYQFTLLIEWSDGLLFYIGCCILIFVLEFQTIFLKQDYGLPWLLHREIAVFSTWIRFPSFVFGTMQ